MSLNPTHLLPLFQHCSQRGRGWGPRWAPACTWELWCARWRRGGVVGTELHTARVLPPFHVPVFAPLGDTTRHTQAPAMGFIVSKRNA